MTIEQAKRDFNQVIMRNGFTEAGYTRDTNKIIYHKIWKEDGATLEVQMVRLILTSCGEYSRIHSARSPSRPARPAS